MKDAATTETTPAADAPPAYVNFDTWKDTARKGSALANVILCKGRDLADVRTVKGEGDEDTVRIIISTGDEDRSHDVINQAGIDLTNYLKNPVVLFGHDYYSPPVAKAPRTYLDGGDTVSLPEFCPVDLYPFGNMIGRMVRGGFMNAASVGFRPRKWVYNEERGGVDFIECELMEYSIVCVPDNPHALAGAKAAWAEALSKSVAAGLDVMPVLAMLEETAGWLVKSGLVKNDPDREAALRILNRGKSTVTGGVIAPREGGVIVRMGGAAEHGDEKVIPLAALVAKAGRVLSKANEKELRDAADSIDVAASRLKTVLAKVEAAPDEETDPPAEDPPADPKTAVAAPPSAPTATTKTAGAEPVVYVQTEPTPESVTVADPAALRGMVKDAMRELMTENAGT